MTEDQNVDSVEAESLKKKLLEAQIRKLRAEADAAEAKAAYYRRKVDNSYYQGDGW